MISCNLYNKHFKTMVPKRRNKMGPLSGIDGRTSWIFNRVLLYLDLFENVVAILVVWKIAKNDKIHLLWLRSGRQHPYYVKERDKKWYSLLSSIIKVDSINSFRGFNILTPVSKCEGTWLIPWLKVSKEERGG